jgi:hypothetical protein
MSLPTTNQTTHPAIPDGVRYARWAGRALGIFLIALSLKNLLSGLEGSFAGFQTAYFIVYGLVLNAPFTRISESRWKFAYGALVLLSGLFVFIMIASVMFAYMAAADRGERLGVPGFEGSLIFLALMQVPAVLFQRKPDLLD